MRSVKKWSSYCHCRWREPTHATPLVCVRHTACSTKRRKKFAHLCLCDAGSVNAGKKFSAGGQAARRSSQTPRRVAGAECLRMCLNGMYEKNSAKEVLFKKPLRKRLCECGVGDRRQRRFASPLADAWRHQTEKYLQKSVDSKKSVIRFRPADIAAEESEQNRHQADTLVPDVHRSTINGGVGFASLQKKRSGRSDHAPVSPFDAGVSVSVPSRITCGRFPTTACRHGVCFNWAFSNSIVH